VSNLSIDFGPEEGDDTVYVDEPRRGGARSAKGGRRAERPRRRSRGCLPMALVLVVVLGVAWFGGSWGVGKVRDLMGESPDYSGPGSGSVMVQVRQGETSAMIGRDLKKAGVVKSVDAFTAAAVADDRSRNIQVGFYELKKQMKASDALAILVNPKNLLQARLTIPEGYRVKDIVKAIDAKTDITAAQVQKALKNTQALGLPAEANGNVEGYLFPATYDVVPGETAEQLLRQMVAKTVSVEKQLDLATKAKALGLRPEQILTVASILEYEANSSEDYPKVARVLYNRMKKGMPLQLDSTVCDLMTLTGMTYAGVEAAFKLDAADYTPARSVANPGAVKTLYSSGQINDGRQLDRVADIELQDWSESAEIHTSFHAWSNGQRSGARLARKARTKRSSGVGSIGPRPARCSTASTAARALAPSSTPGTTQVTLRSANFRSTSCAISTTARRPGIRPANWTPTASGPPWSRRATRTLTS